MEIEIKQGDLAVLRDLVNSIKIKITAIEEYLDKRALEMARKRAYDEGTVEEEEFKWEGGV